MDGTGQPPLGPPRAMGSSRARRGRRQVSRNQHPEMQRTDDQDTRPPHGNRPHGNTSRGDPSRGPRLMVRRVQRGNAQTFPVAPIETRYEDDSAALQVFLLMP